MATPKKSADDFLNEYLSEPTPRDRALSAGGMLVGANKTQAETDRAKLKVRVDDLRKQAEFIDRNTAQDGVPFDIETGVPAGLRAKLSFERSPEKQAKYLSSQPGVVAVRFTDDGRPVVRMRQGEGMVDVLVDEAKTTARDIADMAGSSPQVIAQGATAYVTGGMSIIPQALTVAGVGAAANMISDTTTRAVQGTGQDVGESAGNAAVGFAIDTVLPLAPAGLKRGAQKLLSPFGRTAGEFERRRLVEAVKALEGKTGIKVDLTAAQMTGSKPLAQAEVFAEAMESVPGVGNKLSQQAQAQDEQMRAIQKKILGEDSAPIPSQEEIGQRMSQRLAADEQAMTQEAKALRQEAANSAQGDISRTMVKQSTPAVAITADEAGAIARQRVMALRDEFKAANKANYEAVYAVPGGKLPIVPTTSIKAAVDDVMASMIKNEKGKPIAQLLPPELNQFLSGIKQLPESMPLQQAIALRGQINDMMERGAALPGVPNRFLGQFSNAVSRSIEEGTEKIGDGQLKDALQKAAGYYKENFSKFEQRGVADLFKGADQGGFTTDSTIVNRMFGGAGDVDMIRRYKGLLGEGSQEYKTLVRAGYNKLLDAATPIGRNHIDAGSFLDQMQRMDKSVRKEMFGPYEKTLVDNAELIRAAKGQKIEPEVLDRIFTGNPSSASVRLKQALEIENLRDKFYQQEVVKGITNGLTDPSKIDPDEFVSRFVDKATVSQVNEVFRRLKDPALVDDIKRKTVQSTLQKAARPTQFTDVVDRLTGSTKGPIAAEKLSDILVNDGPKLKAIIGNDSFELLRDYLTVEAARLKKRESGKQAGQLVAANLRSALFTGKISEMPEIAKYKVLSAILTTPGLKQMAASTAKIPDTANLRRMVFSSPAFIRALTAEIGDNAALMNQVSEVIRQDSQEPSARANESVEKFLEQYAPAEQTPPTP